MTTVVHPKIALGNNGIVHSEPVNLNNCIMALTEPYLDVDKGIWYSPVGYSLPIKNGSFELWSNGTNVDPNDWVNNGLLSLRREDGDAKYGKYSVYLNPAQTWNHLYQYLPEFVEYRGEMVTWGCWIKSTEPNSSQITLRDGQGYVDARNTLRDRWEFVSVSKKIADNATFIQVRLYPDNLVGNNAALFDGAMFVKGRKSPPFDKQIGHGNNGIILGATKADRGLYFDGIDDYIEQGDLGFADNAFTLGAWWNQTSSSSTVAPPVSTLKYDRPSAGASFAPCTNSILRICYGRSSGNYMNFTITQAYNFDQWYHTMLTYDGTTLKTYFNGQERDSRSATIPKSVHSYIGRWTTYSSHYFNGSVDDVKICNGAKTGDEVLGEYNLAKERYT